MHVRVSLSALALALAAPALAQSAPVQDFRLPPDPDATATPEVQGPVDPEASVRTAPRVIPTETPTPRPTAQPTPAPTPAPTPTSAPLQLPPQPAPSPRATTTSPAAPTPVQQAPVEDAEPAATAPTGAPADAADSAFDFSPPPTATPPAEQSATPTESGGSVLPWLAALAGLLAAAGAGFWFLRRKEHSAPVPVIEPPLARRQPVPEPESESAPAPVPAPTPATASPARGTRVTVEAKPVRLSRSMMNATFAFQVVIENQSLDSWEDIAIEADLVTAHNAAPVTEQVADTATPLAPLQTISSLASGDISEVAGEVRLPLGQVRAIAQGTAAVYVPLLRLRVAARGKAPIARTFLVGQLPDRQGGRLRPFRLDEMPQSYHAIGMRPLD